MAELHVNGIRLYYEQHGEGEPILCIHGTSSSALMWREAVDELAQLGRVIVYDRRGCTRSERPERYLQTSVSEHTDDAAGLLDTLGATPAVVIGRSYGGEIALDLALRYPERVRGLVLLEGAPLNLSPEASAWEQSLSARVQAAAADDIATVAETLLRGVLGDESWEAFPAQTKRMFTDNGPAILAEFNGGSLTVDSAALATIEKPTLLVSGADSPEAFRQVTDVTATAIPGARTTLVEGDHLVNPAHPAVIDFIRETLATSDAGSIPVGEPARGSHA